MSSSLYFRFIVELSLPASSSWFYAKSLGKSSTTREGSEQLVGLDLGRGFGLGESANCGGVALAGRGEVVSGKSTLRYKKGQTSRRMKQREAVEDAVVDDEVWDDLSRSQVDSTWTSRSKWIVAKAFLQGVPLAATACQITNTVDEDFLTTPRCTSSHVDQQSLHLTVAAC